jgi:hypothetical protein
MSFHLALLAALVATSLLTPGATRVEPSRDDDVDLTIQRKNPLVLRGPAVLNLRPLNRLRYGTVIGGGQRCRPRPRPSRFHPRVSRVGETTAAKEPVPSTPSERRASWIE